MSFLLSNKRSLTGLLLLTSSATIWAAIPDAGQILQEQQRSQRQLPTQSPDSDVSEEPPEQEENGVRVLVNGFKFNGYDGLLSEDELQSLVSENVGKKLSFNQLQNIVFNITQYLKSQGWMLARAYLPDQDITSGIINITIIQGKSDGNININEDSTLRIDQEYLKNIVVQGIQKDSPIKSQALERSLLLINDLPGISAQATLSPGKQPGSTAIGITASEGPILDGSVWADNYGNRYTGTERVNAMLNINDPLRFGDQLSLLFTAAEDLTVEQLNYLTPIYSDGLKASFSYTGVQYDLGEDLSSLNAEGRANTLSSEISYPWIRSRSTNLTAKLGYKFKDLTDSASGTKLHDKRLNSVTLTAMGDVTDRFGGGGITSWSTSVTYGSLDEKIADISITNTEGNYTFFNLSLDRLQRLTNSLTLRVSLSSQISANNLDSSEQFSLGGPYGVRAYPVSEALGDEGHLFNVESSYIVPIPDNFGHLNWNLFYDAGQISLHKDPWTNAIDTATNKNSYWLQGAGTGFEYGYEDNLTIRTSWAHTLGSNDGRSTDSNNSDGKNDKNRFLVQALWYF